MVQSSSMAVQSCWILAGTGTCCRIHRSRVSQTCSVGDMSNEEAGRARTGMFSASSDCVEILATWGHALACCNPEVMVMDKWHNNGPQDHNATRCLPSVLNGENTSTMCQTPSNVSICTLKSVTTAYCSQVDTSMRTRNIQISFPETVSDSLRRNSVVEVLSRCGYTWSAAQGYR